MATIKVPNSYLEPGGQGGIFPAGWYKGALEAPSEGQDRIRAMPWDETERRLSLRFGENTAIDGADPGQQKLFVDITVEAGGYNFETMADAPDNARIGLDISLRLLAQLATAWGWTTENGSGELEVPVDDFIAALDSGTLDGQSATFQTYHKKYYSKKNERQETAVNVRQFVATT